ncbi:MAG TPA: hypothetical protein VNE38_11555 [Ktedonobacteraceae bacterium]|nr:hypothetical protein [Ktedonobacteraceae bacterium]
MTDVYLGRKNIVLYWYSVVATLVSSERMFHMPSLFIRCMLFLSSYFPLAVIFWVIFVAQQPVLAWSAVIVGGFGLLFTLVYVFGVTAKLEPIQEKIAERHEKGSDIMGYVASYLVPFATFSLSGWQQITVFLLFMFILGVIYVNSEMIRVNPVFNLIGYRLYEITVENGEDSVSLITRRRVKRGDTIRIVDVGPGIFLEKVP